LDKDLEIPVETVIKWDDKIKEISIASILAKVSRDRIMENEMDKKYPKYNFKKHKWYWTKEHREKILQYWPCKIHRKLFLRKIFGE
jgi:ribonuclease HII